MSNRTRDSKREKDEEWTNLERDEQVTFAVEEDGPLVGRDVDVVGVCPSSPRSLEML